jgi:hypothetical protein
MMCFSQYSIFVGHPSQMKAKKKITDWVRIGSANGGGTSSYMFVDSGGVSSLHQHPD